MSSAKSRRLPKNGNGIPVLVDGVRSAFVKSFGKFAYCDALELFSPILDGLLRRVELDPNELDEVLAGVVVPQSKNPNVARDALLSLGLPRHIYGSTTNMACTSSLATIVQAAKTIKSGEPCFIMAGGVECISDPPIFYSKNARQLLGRLSKIRSLSGKANLLRHLRFKDLIPTPPSITEPLTGLSMGDHAEIMAKMNHVSREAQDSWAMASHQKAHEAQIKGKFREEIVPIWPSPTYDSIVEDDDLIRPETSNHLLKRLNPSFDKKFGTITAGNSSPLTDGAACVLITDEKLATDLKLKVKARIIDYCFVGVEPKEQLLIGPAIAIPLLLRRNNLSIDHIDLFEIHEAFAAQVLSCLRCMESKEFNFRHFGVSTPFGSIPIEKINVNGGAIAIGHPFGATGARLVLTLANELARTDKRLGTVAICASGGMAGALLLERIF